MSETAGQKAAQDKKESDHARETLFEEIIKREVKFHRLHDQYRVTLSMKKSIVFLFTL